MAQLNAYVKFNGNCRQAMTFYKDCLGGELALQAIGESPMANHMPAEMKDNILHSSLVNDGIMLMASDMTRPEGVVIGNAISLCLVCSSEQEIKTVYSKLAAGGQATTPLKEEFFGTFGDLTDKFGMSWMFQYSKTPQT